MYVDVERSGILFYLASTFELCNVDIRLYTSMYRTYFWLKQPLGDRARVVDR